MSIEYESWSLLFMLANTVLTYSRTLSRILFRDDLTGLTRLKVLRKLAYEAAGEVRVLRKIPR
jgi:hypothetical protein